MAEAYWDLEWALQQQGFDYCYDKRLYDRLVHERRRGGARAPARPTSATSSGSSASSRTTTSRARRRPSRREQARAAAVDDAEPDRGAARPRGPARGPRRCTCRSSSARRPDEQPDPDLKRVLRAAADARSATTSSATASGSSASARGWDGNDTWREPRRLGLARRRSAQARRRQPRRRARVRPRLAAVGRPARPDVAARRRRERRGLRAQRRRPPRRPLRRARAVGVAPLRPDATRLHGGLTDAESRPGDRRARPAGRGDRPRRGRPLLGEPLVRVGPVPERARLGHGPRGLLRGRRRLGVLPARPRPLARVPLERGRHGRHLRHPPRALPRARALERQRPDPEGADVRPDRAAGQPRRGRQGVLVVPRGAAEPRAAAAGATTTRRPRSRTSSSSHHGRGLAGSRARAARHRRLRRRPLLVGRRHLREGLADRGADADRGREPRADEATLRRAADAVVPQHLVVGRRTRRARASQRDGSALAVADHALAGYRLEAAPGPDGALPRGALLRERDERAARLRVAPRPRRTRRTGSTTTSSPARRRSTRTASAPRRRLRYR